MSFRWMPGIRTALLVALSLPGLLVEQCDAGGQPNVQKPAGVSVTPDSGAGYSHVFAFRYADPKGAADIGVAEADFYDEDEAPPRRCGIGIDTDRSQVRLYPPARGGLVQTGAIGSPAALRNAVCTVDPSAVSFRRNGNQLEVQALVTFTPAFDGRKVVMLFPWDHSGDGLASGARLGHWFVGANPPPEPPVAEDCLALNPAGVEVKLLPGGWTLVDRAHYLFTFKDERAARSALQVIEHYGVTRTCSVGRGTGLLQYLLVKSAPPAGAMPGERCEALDPSALVIRQDSRTWTIVEGDRSIYSYGDRELEASQALELLAFYRFTNKCSLGSSASGLTYLRQ